MDGENGGAEHVVIVGTGRMGLALGAAMHASGAAGILTFMGRALEPPPHPLFDPRGAEEGAVRYHILPATVPRDATALILAVPDHAIAEVAYDLAAMGPAPPGCCALHLSGALSTDVLAPLHGAGYALGSMHPLMAVADPWLAAERLMDAAYALAGDPVAVATARRLVCDIGGSPFVVAPTFRPIYHAAAVMASNYLVALTSAAVRMMGDAGVEEDQALRALIPLLRGTLANMQELGLPAALTGPIPRGDADTVRLHLGRLSPGDRALYSGLGLELLRLARAAGLDPARADEIESILASG